MLRSLSIRDYVIVDTLELDFSDGFTVLTGETGAGKSILIDALSLALGERAEAGVVRPGASKAEVSAEFDVAKTSPLRDWLTQNDFNAEEQTCLLRRVVDAAGKSRGFINGSAATLAQMREAGEMLIDIHGQHAHQSLLKPDVQRNLLDGYAGLQTQAQDVRALHKVWNTLHQTRIAREKNAAAFAAERDGLQYQVKELISLNFSADAWAELQADHSRLAHAASLIEGAQQSLDELEENDNALVSQVTALTSKLSQLVEYDPQLKEVIDVLEPAQIQLQEAAYALRHYVQKLDLDPARLKQIEARMDAIHNAARKYRVKPDGLAALLVQSQAHLEALGGDEGDEELGKKESAAHAKFLDAAKKLSAARKKAAKEFSKKITDAMQTLAMEGGSFDAMLIDLAEPNAHGAEQIEFRVAAHKGMTAGSLAKVASGGELSRVSLAIQVIASKVAAVPTLIFDEVDAGIGGRVAEIVGQMLQTLGKQFQVLCVTHLPQVAACGDQQWSVAKSAVNGTVKSQITALDKKARVEEIARMLGGVKITETTRKHAAEMLGK
jgi:DNA repair protein RecN (Recombination protein N)